MLSNRFNFSEIQRKKEEKVSYLLSVSKEDAGTPQGNMLLVKNARNGFFYQTTLPPISILYCIVYLSDQEHKT
jgi:hypothetical protein